MCVCVHFIAVILCRISPVVSVGLQLVRVHGWGLWGREQTPLSTEPRPGSQCSRLRIAALELLGAGVRAETWGCAEVALAELAPAVGSMGRAGFYPSAG